MTKKEVTSYSQQTFESIKHINENGAEFWYARELQVALEYTEWRNFEKSVKRAKEACTASGFIETDHFVDVNKMVDLGSGSQHEITDIKLSRYACYLIVMNGDPRNKMIALCKTYFAIMTCRNLNGLGMKDIHKRKGLNSRTWRNNARKPPHSRKKCEIVEERTLEKSREEIKKTTRGKMCLFSIFATGFNSQGTS